MKLMPTRFQGEKFTLPSERESIMLKKAKLIKIGNSQGIRLPKGMISRYGFGERVMLQEVQEGILIHAVPNGKLSWEDTYKAMAHEEHGEWSDWQDLDIDRDSHV
jgi:antitoxin MazE